MRPAIINIMDGAARKAARSLIHDFNEVEHLQVSRKGPADFVSEADRRAENILKRELEAAHPNFSLLLEESGLIGDTKAIDQWIVDPLDGTTNFLHAIPHFCISIAHAHKGEVIEGIIFDPVRDEFFWAAKGHGAYIKNQRIRVSARGSLSDAVLATGIPFLGHGNAAEHAKFGKELQKIMSVSAGVRRFGSAALDLAYVAAGRYDGFWERGLNSWDIAAGILLVREAGGFVSDFASRDRALDSGDIVAANPSIHAKLLKCLNANTSHHA